MELCELPRKAKHLDELTGKSWIYCAIYKKQHPIKDAVIQLINNDRLFI